MMEATRETKLWHPVMEELDAWAAQGLTAPLWLRDDDAVAPSSALDRLLTAAGRHKIPVLLAVIPGRAEPELARRVAGEPSVHVAVHGWLHANHAPRPEKPAELGGHRPLREVLADLSAGLDRTRALFGPQALPALVPPWNRICSAAVAELPSLAFTSLSVFGDAPLAEAPDGLSVRNTHVDIIDWKGNRGGRDHAWLVRETTHQLTVARQAGGRPTGVLTHHLVHDAVATSFLEDLFAVTTSHSAARWKAFDELPS